MSEACSGESDSGSILYEGRNTTVFGAADWLSFVAAPAFAIMALLTGVLGGCAPNMLCSPAQAAAPLRPYVRLR